jgi:ABC-type antimicrobial peptide transport system permease subunit
MDFAAEARMVPTGVHPPPPSEVDLRFAPGVDHARASADFARRLGPAYVVLTPRRPSDLVNFGRVQNLPVILAALLGLLGVATLGQTLIAAIRRHRRDLSILKALGFSSAQVRQTVAWQASTFVAGATLLGLPLGIAAGRLAWTVFAHRLGTAAVPVEPVLVLGLMIPAAILLANLVAAVPAVVASRTHPARVLRTE